MRIQFGSAHTVHKQSHLFVHISCDEKPFRKPRKTGNGDEKIRIAAKHRAEIFLNPIGGPSEGQAELSCQVGNRHGRSEVQNGLADQLLDRRFGRDHARLGQPLPVVINKPFRVGGKQVPELSRRNAGFGNLVGKFGKAERGGNPRDAKKHDLVGIGSRDINRRCGWCCFRGQGCDDLRMDWECADYGRFWCFLGVKLHSCRMLSTGSFEAARTAGASPNKQPTATLTPSPRPMTAAPSRGCRSVSERMSRTPPVVSTKPESPPDAVSSTDSTRNCAKMWLLRAPTVFRIPISRCRSFTFISITV